MVPTLRRPAVIKLLSIVFLSLFMVAALSSRAHALNVGTALVDGNSPSPADSNAANPTDNPWHLLIQSDHGSVGSIKLGVYFNNNTSDKTFTINVATGYCNIYAASGYAKSNDYLFIDGLKTNGNSTGISGNAACTSLDGRTFTIQKGVLSANFRGTGLYGAVITIRWVNDGDPGAPTGIRSNIRKQANGAGSNVRFKLKMSSGRVGYVDTSDSSGDPNNSVVHANTGKSPQDDYTSIYYPFGLSCNADSAQKGKVTLYDADQGLAAQDTPIYFYVATVAADGKTTPLSDSDYVEQGGQIKVADTGTNPTQKYVTINANGNGWSPGDGTKYTGIAPGGYDNKGGETTVTLQSMQPGQHYVLIVKDLGHGQFIYIGLPGDAINGSPDFTCPSTSTNEPGVKCVEMDIAPTGVISPGQTVTADVTGDTFGYQPALSPPGTLHMVLSVTPATPGSPYSANPVRSGGQYENVFNVRSMPPGLYTFTATVSDPARRLSASCSNQTIRVANTPYLSVYGGDASAGMTATTDGSKETCVASPPSDLAGFISWNNGGSAGWGGAGGQFAVQALGNIEDFASGRGSNPDISPTGLSFSNSVTNTSGTPRLFGGGIGAITGVGCDYTSGVTFTTTDTTATYSNTGNGAVTGTQTILVKNHDAIISGSIIYANSNSWNLATIPSFKLVVQGGNIYIGSNVSILSGTYVAEKNTSGVGKGGTIYTCATGTVPAKPRDSGFYNLCNHSLTIYGSFVAQQVQFLRTSGSVGSASAADSWSSGGAAAEKFVYSPEMWLANLKAQPGGTDASITGLPPIL